MEQSYSFPERLRRERDLRGWSQADLAEQVGSDTKTVGRWENGASLPRPKYRQRLLALFDISAEAFGLTTQPAQRSRKAQAPLQVTPSAPSQWAPTMLKREQEGQAHILHEDWGEAPSPAHFYGRTGELEELKQWITHEGCRVIALLGMGGIGKTAIAARLAEQVKADFEYVFWRSLQNTPPLEQILKACLQFISDQQRVKLPPSIEEQIQLLISYLREHRCLLILDNFESILQPGKRVGSYREGYEAYGRFIQRLGETHHRSCLLLTSREKPKEAPYLEGKTAPVRMHSLPGVGLAEGQAILREKGLTNQDEPTKALIAWYSGNPLALRLIAETIQTLFAGDIERFLKEGQATFGNIHELLDQHFHRLSLLEREVLTWLAIEREPVALEDIHKDLVRPLSRGELLEAFDALRKRSMIEDSGSARFTLQPVIMEYVTQHLVRRACKEFGTELAGAWLHFAFVKAQTRDYVRGSQERQIVDPIAERLLKTMGKELVAHTVSEMLAAQRQESAQPRGYLASNALELLLHIQYDVRGLDVSHQIVRQAYLQGAALPEVNFSSTHFIDTVFSGTFSNILSVAFSPDGALLAAGTAQGEIWIVQAQTGTPLFTLQGHTDGVWSLAFSPNGQLLLSGSDDESVRLWDMQTRDCLRLLSNHSYRVRAVCFSPDGKLFASGSDDQAVCLWETTSGKCLARLQGHTGRVWSIAFHPRGQLLASASTDQSIRVWNVASGQCTRIFTGHTHWVRAVAWSPDGHLLASGSNDYTVRLWNMESGECLETLQGHSNHVWSVTFSSDSSLLASSSEDQTIRFWNIPSAHCLRTLHEHTHGVRAVAFNHDSNVLASGGDDQALRLWEVQTGNCLMTLQGHSDRIWSVAFNKDGSAFASCSEDQTIRLWDTSTGTCLKSIREPMHGARAVALAPTGLLATCGEDQTVRLWDMATGRCLKVLRGHTDWLRCVTFSPDGGVLASGGEDHTIRLWDREEGRCLHTLIGHSSWIRAIVFSPDGSVLASGGDDHTIRLWDVHTGHCLQTLEGHSDRIRSLAFHPDGHTLVSGSEDHTIRLWEVNNGRCTRVFEGHTSWVMSVAFSFNGNFLVSGSDDHMIRLWDGEAGACLRIVKGHEDRVRSVTFNPAGDVILSGSDDGTMKLWDAQTLACIRIYRGERPYERMNIAHAQGLTDAQRATLRTLGAIENDEMPITL